MKRTHIRISRSVINEGKCLTREFGQRNRGKDKGGRGHRRQISRKGSEPVTHTSVSIPVTRRFPKKGCLRLDKRRPSDAQDSTKVSSSHSIRLLTQTKLTMCSSELGEQRLQRLMEWPTCLWVAVVCRVVVDASGGKWEQGQLYDLILSTSQVGCVDDSSSTHFNF